MRPGNALGTDSAGMSSRTRLLAFRERDRRRARKRLNGLIFLVAALLFAAFLATGDVVPVAHGTGAQTVAQPLIFDGNEADHFSFYDPGQLTPAATPYATGGGGSNWYQHFFIAPDGAHYADCGGESFSSHMIYQTGLPAAAQTPIVIGQSSGDGYGLCMGGVWIDSQRFVFDNYHSLSATWDNVYMYDISTRTQTLVAAIHEEYPYTSDPLIEGIRIWMGFSQMTYSKSLHQLAFVAGGYCESKGESYTVSAIYGFDPDLGISSAHRIDGGSCNDNSPSASFPTYQSDWVGNGTGHELAYLYTPSTATPSWDIYRSTDGINPGSRYTNSGAPTGVFGNLTYSPQSTYLSYCYSPNPLTTQYSLYVDTQAVTGVVCQNAGTQFSYAWSADETTIAYVGPSTDPGASTYSRKLHLLNFTWVPGGSYPSGNGNQDYIATGVQVFNGIAWGRYYQPPLVPASQTFGGPGGSAAVSPTGFLAEPVNTASGSYYTAATDVKLAGVGVPFSFTRSYNSADTTVGRLGQGWVDNFDWSATTTPNGDVTVRAGSGQTLHFSRQLTGAFVADAGGRASLAVNGSGYELVTSSQLHYLFDSQGRLAGLHDRNGQGLTLAYDANGLASVTDSAGRVEAVSMSGGLLQQVTLPDGRYVHFSYTGGLLTSVRDARGGMTSYGYDSGSRLKTIVDQNLHTLVTNTYDPTSARVIEQDDARGNPSYFSWDPATQTSTFTDARGKLWKDVYANNVLLKRIDPLNNTTTYFYDGNLDVVAVTDPRNNVTRMSYDSKGNLLSRAPPAPFSFSESWTYDGLNDVKTHTDGRGNTTSYGYDSAGNLTSITGADPDGTGPLAAPVTTITRDPAGTGLATAIQDPRGKTTQYGYDSQHNLTSVTTPLLETTTIGYDGSGRLTSRVDPRGNLQGADPAQFTWQYTYNEFDQLHTQTDPLNHVSRLDYYPDGSLQTKTDANGHLTSDSYWPSNQLKTVTAPDPDGTGPLSAPVTSYAYDPAGNLSGRSDANTHATAYGYDDAGRLISAQTQLGKLTTYGYDGDGNLTSTVDANGNATQTAGDGTTSYGYDNLNRLVSVTYSDAPATPNLSFSYDEVGNRKTMTDGAGTVNYSYDNLNQLTSVSRGSNIFSYAYDPAGNVSQRTYPDSTVASYAYNDDGGLQSLTNTSVGTTSYGYDAAGNLQTTTLPIGNGYVESRVYDNAGRLTETKDAKNGSTLSDFTQTLDPVGNPQTLTRTGSIATTQVYGYDNLDRLTSVCYQASCPNNTDPKIAWTYDPVGNRQTETRATSATSYSYDGDDRLTQTSTPGTSPYQGQVQADGAQPYWRLGEPSGTTTFASSVGSYTGTWGTGSARPTLGTTGALNSDPNTAATFNGTSQYGNVANAAGLNKTNNFSLELWLKRTTSGALQAIAGKPLTTTTKSENYAIWLTTANKPQFEVGAGTGNKSAVIASSTAITDTTGWHHIVGTFTSGVLKIYLDGTLTGANSSAGFTSVTTNSSTFDVGRAGTSNYFGGSLDEIALYGAALTATQITDHYNKGHNTPPPAVTAYGYDNDGRQTSNGTNTYTYDLANQLVGATVNSVATSYSYDGDSNRLTTVSGGVTTNEFWDTNYGLPQLALERDSSNNLLRRYLIGNDINSLTTPAGNFFYHHDPLGSVSNMTDSTGATQWTYAYEPNGTPTSQTVKNSPTAPANPLQYTGQYQDPTSNLYNLRARQYDTGTGRFLSPDPAGAAAGSTYAFTDNQPTVFVDPSGLGLGLPGWVSKPLHATWNGARSFGSAWYEGITNHPVCVVIGVVGGTVAVAADIFSGGAATPEEEALAEEGIYIVRGANETYVGQSGSIPARLAQHVQSGRFTQAEADAAERIAVSGGKTAREIAEQQKIDELGGIGKLGNVRNPIGPRRFGLMPQGYARP